MTRPLEFFSGFFVIKKMSENMKRIYTLKKNYEFKNVLKKGQYFVRKHVIIYIYKKYSYSQQNVIILNNGKKGLY